MSEGKNLSLQRCSSLKGLPSRRKQRENEREHVSEKLQRRLPKFNQFSQNGVFDRHSCTIVTIERHSPDRFSTGPLYIYVRSTHTRVGPPESSCCIEPIIVYLPTPPRTAPFWVSAEVLTNHSTMYKVYLRDAQNRFHLSRVVALTKKQELILKAIDKSLLNS
jgi:hypothetical protein